MKELLWVLLFLVLITFGISCGAFVGEDVAARALDVQGYSDVKITDHSWFLVGFRGCDESDAARFTAVAKNPAGKYVKVYVCSGWILKGATVRTR